MLHHYRTPSFLEVFVVNLCSIILPFLFPPFFFCLFLCFSLVLCVCFVLIVCCFALFRYTVLFFVGLMYGCHSFGFVPFVSFCCVLLLFFSASLVVVFLVSLWINLCLFLYFFILFVFVLFRVILFFIFCMVSCFLFFVWMWFCFVLFCVALWLFQGRHRIFFSCGGF